MQIDDKLITYLEDLSCLSLGQEERVRLADDLGKILAYVDSLSGLNTDGIPERSHPFDNVNVFRDDEVTPSMDRELILKNAVQKNDECFIAPKTVE